MTTLQKIAFLKPRTGLDGPAFTRYWRETHGPLVAGSLGYETWRRFYAQNHPVGPGPIGGAFPWSGMAAFALPDAMPNEDAFSLTDIYRTRIAPDEARFINMDGTRSFTAASYPIVEGFGPRKLVLTAKYRTARAQIGADAISAIMAAARLVRSPCAGWVLNVALPRSGRLPGARADEAAADLVHEIWFRDEVEAEAFAHDLARHADLIPAADGETPDVFSFFAEEFVFFDADRRRPLSRPPNDRAL